MDAWHDRDVSGEVVGGSPPTEDMLDRLIREAQEEPPREETAKPTQAPPATSPMGGLLSGLMSNPALLQALPQLMGSLGPLLGGGKTRDAADTKAVAATQDTPVVKQPHVSVDRHTALLCAVKPYLSRERQQAAEYMISLCRVWSTLQGMGISLPMPTSALTGGEGEKTSEEQEVSRDV